MIIEMSFQGLSELHIKFQANLGYSVRPYLKN